LPSPQGNAAFAAGAQHVLELGLARQAIALAGLLRQPIRVSERIVEAHVHDRQGRRGDPAHVVAAPVNAFVFGKGPAFLVVHGGMTGARCAAAVAGCGHETAEIRHRGLVARDGEAAAERHRVQRRFLVLPLRILLAGAHPEVAVGNHHHLRRAAAGGQPLAEILARWKGP
jgi:hypothetical protein